MIRIKDYNLQSFTVGTKHVRCFSVDNCQGVITDYVLAKCGADNSPFVSGFYNRIINGEGAIKLHNPDDTTSYAVTRDNIAITQRSSSIEDDLDGVEITLKQAKHIIPDTLAFMNNPKAKLLGMVWQFTEKQKHVRERFKHPVAEEICKRLLKFDIKNKEYPAESHARLAFRKKLSKSYLMKGQDDFLNIIINVGDQAINDLWPDTEDIEPKTKVVEGTRVGYVSIDIQIMFDPRRGLTEKAIKAHWSECQLLKSRIAEILKGVGFETE